MVTTTGYCPASDGLASLIDHTLLKPDATRADIEKICQEAAQFCFASVCVNPVWVPLCHDLLKGSGVKVCTVIGFPSGAHAPDVKAYEARRAVEQGAEEVDMVINVGAMKSKDYALVEQDIRGVVQAAAPQALVKVILETSLLTREEKIMGCTLAKAAGADFVKTSTGFARRRRHGRGHRADARDRGPRDGREGLGRGAHQGGGRGHGRGRGHAHRRLGRREDRARREDAKGRGY